MFKTAGPLLALSKVGILKPGTKTSARDGRIKPPVKDGRKNFWLNSYVLSCIRQGADENEIQELRA
ncbi:hypothetical protein J588_3256 [Acinetobacter sp. 1578804]|nr:hypothetical protein J588_3256 [Acinetobacter sp. 1578804]